MSSLLNSKLAAVVADGDVSELLKEMEAYTACDRDSDEDDGSVDSCVVASPLNLMGITQDEEKLLDALCFGNAQHAVATAVAQRQFATALLFSYYFSDESLIRYIALRIQNQPSSAVMRISALMAVGMWNEIVALWNTNDWKRLFCLILSHAPSRKIRRLCSDLAKRMVKEGHIVSAALPAVVAGDIETMVMATEMYPNEERMALAAILRQSVGGGSSRAVTAGVRYQYVLMDFAGKLVKEGQFALAWEFMSVIPSKDCIEGLRQLHDILSNAYWYTPVPGTNTAVTYGNPLLNESFEIKPVSPPPLPTFSYISSSHTESLCVNSNPPQSFPPCMTSYEQYFPPLPPTQAQLVTEYHNGVVTSRLNRIEVPQSPPQAVFTTPPALSPPEFPDKVRSRQTSLSSSDSRSGAGIAGAFCQPNDSASVPLFKRAPFVPVHGAVNCGWNDPPLVDLKKSESQALAADVAWSPYSQQSNGPLVENVASSTILQSGSVVPINAALPIAPVDILLSEVDTRFVESLRHVVHDIRQKTNELMTLRKLDNIEQKITIELIPRLARVKFSQTTLLRLYEIVERLLSADFRGCHLVIGNLARGSDFTELSAILPALKTLVSSARQYLY